MIFYLGLIMDCVWIDLEFYLDFLWIFYGLFFLTCFWIVC